MKVYIVFSDRTGDVKKSVQAFSTREAADRYGQKMISKGAWAYSIEERELQVQKTDLEEEIQKCVDNNWWYIYIQYDIFGYIELEYRTKYDDPSTTVRIKYNREGNRINDSNNDN